MEKVDYLESKKFKKKKAQTGVWIIIALGVVFIFTLLKFAGNSGMGSIMSVGLPSSDEAYAVSKEFVKATTHSDKIDFPDSGYQFAKKTDSIYVIKSTLQSTSQNGETRTLNFKAVIEFKGGRHDNLSNWSLLNIIED